MRRRLGLLAAALIVASLWIVPWLLVACVAEKPAPPSYTPDECAAGDQACAGGCAPRRRTTDG